MDAEEFFKQRPEDTECILSGIELGAGEAGNFRFETKPWWKSGENAEFLITMAKITEFSLHEGIGSVVQSLGSSQESPLFWNYQPQGSIFGHAPLPDPPRFFHEFHELILGTLGIKRDPITYLNWQKNFLGWRNIVLSRTYQLLHAPWQVVEASTELLDAQVADYHALPDRDVELPTEVPEIALEFGNSWVLGAGLEVQF